MEASFLGSIFVLIISIMIFLLCREIVCWYFKINEFIKINKEILSELQNKNNISSARNKNFDEKN